MLRAATTPAQRAVRGRRSGALATLVLVTLSAAIPALASEPSETREPSELMPLASRSLLLDVARAGERLVAVGERGHVLLSDDTGATWTQVVVPTRVTLTAVAFPTPEIGWAAGHEAIILRTDDGGATWALVHESPGEDLPLLDLAVLDDGRGLAAGAYGTLLATADGGQTWEETGVALADSGDAADEGDEEFDDGFGPADVHLNRLARARDGTLYAAGEAGNLLRSDDEGASWTELPSPYEGSFFAVHAGADGTVVAAGLRGHLFRSADRGASWTEIATGTEALLTGVVPLGDGRLAVHGLAGTVLELAPDGTLARTIELPAREGIAGALATADGGLLLVGDFGTLRLGPDLAPSVTPR